MWLPEVEALKTIKAAKKVSIRELSNKTGITTANISRILSGKTRSPHQDTLKKIAEALGYSYESIIENRGGVIANSILNVGNGATIHSTSMPTELATGKGNESGEIRVSGSALHPDVKDGDTVYYNENERVNDGDIVAAEADGLNASVVRKVLKGENGDIWLLATNPDWPGEKKLKAKRILGVVTERRTRVPRG